MPSGVKYSPVQTRHRRNKSLGKLNEMLKHRQSIDLGKSPFAPGSTLALSSGTTMESVTRSKFFRTARYGRSSRITPPPSGMGKDRIENGNEIDGIEMQSEQRYRDSPDRDTDKKAKKVSTFRRKLILNFGRSRSQTPNSDDSRQSSGDHSKSKLRNLLSRRSKTPETTSDRMPEKKTPEMPTTPTRPKSDRVRRSGVSVVQMSEGGLGDYEPSLSPIKGTPTHKATRRPPSLQEGVEEPDSGFGMNTNQTEATIIKPSSPTTPDHVEGLPMFSKKATLGRRGTVTGVEMSRLPFSNVGGHINRRESLEEDAKKNQEFFLSPSQLLRQLKKQRGQRKKKVSTSVFYTQLDSIPPIVTMPGNASTEGDESSKLSPFSMSRSTEDESMCISQDSAFLASKELDVSASTEHSITPTSSDQLSFVDSSFQRSSTSSIYSRDSRDEVDFGTISEKDTKTLVPTRKLIKSLDLSSNLLTGLQELWEELGSSYVVQRLKGLRKLDLKQNQIKKLPKELMQVCAFCKVV